VHTLQMLVIIHHLLKITFATYLQHEQTAICARGVELLVCSGCMQTSLMQATYLVISSAVLLGLVHLRQCQLSLNAGLSAAGLEDGCHRCAGVLSRSGDGNLHVCMCNCV
jgi:hypothetical protein